MKHHNRHTKKQAGFALLMTIIVVGVVLSVGLSILDLSIKQVRLSTNAKDSEIAFHAANAGLECARFVRRDNAVDMEAGNTAVASCFDGTTNIDPNTGSDPQPTLIGDGEAYLYEYEFTWGPAGSDRCTKIGTLVMSADLLQSGATTTNMIDLFPGFPDGAEYNCEPGGRCTVVSVRGYNRACGTVDSYGVVEREVLLQF